MKTKLKLITICLLLVKLANAQNNMGVGTITPNPSSVLDLSANDKGFLAPRMTTPQKLAITNPATGLLVYDITTNGFWYFDGVIWVQAMGLAGPQGPTGPIGLTGATGSNGVTGPTGPNWNITSLNYNTDGSISLVTDQPNTYSSLQNAWLTSGNSGTNSGTNFIGTTDANDLVMKAGGSGTTNDRMRLLNTSNTVVIGQNEGSVAPINTPVLLRGAQYVGSDQPGGRLIIQPPNGTGIWGSGSITFETAPPSVSGTTPNTMAERMRIDNTGNVGIGTTSPGFKLEVNGVGQFSGATQIGSGISQGYYGDAANLALRTYNSTASDIYFQTYGGAATNMIIKNNGYVGIGTTTPLKSLDVIGEIQSSSNITCNGEYYFHNWQNSVKGLAIESNAGNASQLVTIRFEADRFRISGAISSGNVPERITIIKSNGYVGLSNANPLYKLELTNDGNTDGQARANAWVTFSDSRLKFNQHQIEYGLKQVMELKPKSYVQRSSEWQEGKLIFKDDGVKTFGVIAQELYEIIPEMVHKPVDESKDLWSVDYDKFAPVLIKAIQDQQQEIEAQKAEIENLKAVNSNLITEIGSIKNIKAQIDVINEQLHIKSEK